VRADIWVGSPEEQGGFTLIELMIVLSLLTVVFAFCMTALVSLQRSVLTVDSRTQTLDQVRLAVQQIDREVRSGNIFYSPFTTPGGTSGSNMNLLVFTQANGNNRCVEWQVNPTQQVLQSRSWTQTWQTDGSPSIVHWSTIATDVTNTSSNPPFALDSSTSYGGRVLNIDIATNSKTSQSGGSEVTDSVEGRNTVYGYSVTSCNAPYPASS
jgi:prepilin-type N-terminal cleavage/methylation domain-containing protein